MAIVGEEMGSHLQGSKSFFYVIIFCFFACLCVCFLGLGGLSCHWDFQNKSVRGAIYFIRPAVFVATICSSKNFFFIIFFFIL